MLLEFYFVFGTKHNMVSYAIPFADKIEVIRNCTSCPKGSQSFELVKDNIHKST